MIQQVNLFLPEFRSTKDVLSALLMAQVVGGVLLLMLLVSSYQFYTRWQLNSDLVAGRATLQEETRKTSELDDMLTLRSQNTELTTRLARAEARLDASRQISTFLGQTTLGNITGFSEYMKDLSRASVDGLTISEFQITDGGSNVRLAGQVLDSALVPRFVSNIQNGQSELRSKQYSPTISRADAGQAIFDFSLSTESE